MCGATARCFSASPNLARRKPLVVLTCNNGVEAIDEIVHHCFIFIDHVGKNRKAVIVDDRVDLSSQWRQKVLYYPANLLDVIVVANDKSLEIDKESVLLRMVGKSALQGNAS